MKSSSQPPNPPVTEPAESTGLPGIRRWRTVYLIVLGVFITWVALLTWLTEHYS